MAKKLTKREVYSEILKGNLTDEVLAEVKGYIKALDDTNAKRKDKKTAEQKETDTKVLAVLTTEYAKAKDIADKIEGYSISKVVASCKRLKAEGKVKIDKKDEGSRNVSYYALVDTEEEETE